MKFATHSPSLTRRLLLMLVGSLSVVALVLGAGGAWLINGIVERTADRLLGASARSISETLAVEDGEITLDLPPFALGMLENNERDNIYYSVRHDAELITGYPNLPSPRLTDETENPVFRYATFQGARIRIATDARRLPRVPGVIVVQVAETLEARRELSQRMFVGLAVLEAVLVGLAGLLVWPAVRWSMKPVTRLRTHMDERQHARADFTQLPLDDVPVELKTLVAGFNGLLTRLAMSVEGMRRFTADASHQMRTPLAILRTHLAVLRKHPLASEAVRNSVSDISHATDRLQSLLTGLIALARADEATPQAPPPAIDLSEVARAAAAEYVSMATKLRVRLECEPSSEPAVVRADPVLIIELLSNLIDNAIRYNTRGGHVVVRATMAEGHPVLQVEDDGPGVPAEDRGKIFQRFFRLQRDHGQTGSGLGLSIVAAIAERLRTGVTVSSGPGGRGLCVSVAFDRAAAGQDGPSAIRRARPGSRRPS